MEFPRCCNKDGSAQTPSIFILRKTVLPDSYRRDGSKNNRKVFLYFSLSNATMKPENLANHDSNSSKIYLQNLIKFKGTTLVRIFHLWGLVNCFISLIMPSVSESTSLFFPKNFTNSMLGFIRYLHKISKLISHSSPKKHNCNF